MEDETGDKIPVITVRNDLLTDETSENSEASNSEDSVSAAQQNSSGEGESSQQSDKKEQVYDAENAQPSSK